MLEEVQGEVVQGEVVPMIGKVKFILIFLIIVTMTNACTLEVIADNNISEKEWQAKMSDTDFLESFEVPFLIVAACLVVGIILLLMKKKIGFFFIVIPAALFFSYCAMQIKRKF